MISHWDEGWKVFDAELAARDYSPDADWTNAFGRVRKGKTEIFEYLAEDLSEPSHALADEHAFEDQRAIPRTQHCVGIVVS